MINVELWPGSHSQNLWQQDGWVSWFRKLLHAMPRCTCTVQIFLGCCASTWCSDNATPALPEYTADSRKLRKLHAPKKLPARVKASRRHAKLMAAPSLRLPFSCLTLLQPETVQCTVVTCWELMVAGGGCVP